MKINKKKVLWVSGIIAVGIIILDRIGTYKICGEGNFSCIDILASTLRTFLSFIPLFIFSLITYKMRDEVFQLWLGFAKWWIPMSMILVLITPDGQGGGYMPSLVDKPVVAFLTSFVFIIISIIIIIYKSVKLCGK